MNHADNSLDQADCFMDQAKYKKVAETNDSSKSESSVTTADHLPMDQDIDEDAAEVNDEKTAEVNNEKAAEVNDEKAAEANREKIAEATCALNIESSVTGAHNLLIELASDEKATTANSGKAAVVTCAPKIGNPDVITRADLALDRLRKGKPNIRAVIDGLPCMHFPWLLVTACTKLFTDNTKTDQRYRIRYNLREMMSNNQYCVVAAMDLPVGSVIMAEAPLLFTSANDMSGVDELFARYRMLRFPNQEAYDVLKLGYEFILEPQGYRFLCGSDLRDCANFVHLFRESQRAEPGRSCECSPRSSRAG